MTITTSPLDINAGNEHSYGVEGTCEQGLEVSVQVGILPPLLTPCHNSTWQLASLDTTGLAEGSNYTLSVVQTDSASNLGLAERSFDKDITFPRIRLNSPTNVLLTNENQFFLYGTCSESGRNVTINLASTPPVEVLCQNRTWRYEVDLSDDSLYPEGPLYLVLTHRDHLGNETRLDDENNNLIKDKTPPVLTLDSPGLYNKAVVHGHYTLEGSCESPFQVTVEVEYFSTTNVDCEQGRWSFQLSHYWYLPRNDGITIPIRLSSVDNHGNRADLTGSFFYDYTEPRLTITSDLTMNSSNTQGFKLEGTCSENDQPVIFRLNDLDEETITCTAQSWSFSIPSDLLEGDHRIQLTHRDHAENTMTLQASLHKDLNLPMFTLAENLDIDLSHSHHYVIRGTCQDPGNIAVNAPIFPTQRTFCDLATNTWETSGVSVVDADSGSITLTATMTDSGGNTLTLNKEITKPVCPTDVPSRPFAFNAQSLSLNSSNQNDYRIEGTCAEDGPLSLSIPYHETMTVSCGCGTWKSEALHSYNFPVGEVAIQASKTQ